MFIKEYILPFLHVCEFPNFLHLFILILFYCGQKRLRVDSFNSLWLVLWLRICYILENGLEKKTYYALADGFWVLLGYSDIQDFSYSGLLPSCTLIVESATLKSLLLLNCLFALILSIM